MSSLLKLYPTQIWLLPTHTGQSGDRNPGFQELSPPQPITTLQFWVYWIGLTGGDATSTVDLTVFTYSLVGGEAFKTTCNIGKIITDTTPAASYELTADADPADGGVHLRIGNFNDTDTKQLRFFGEYFYAVIDNAGTAYTAGEVKVAPAGWAI